MKNVVTL